MQITSDKIYQDLIMKGHCVFEDINMFRYLYNMDSYEWNHWKDEHVLQLVKRNPEIEQTIQMTQELIGETYIKSLDPNYTLGGDCEIVNGMDNGTLTWHNDEVEGYQFAVLLYWDDLDEDTGGNIEFRHMQSKESAGGFYPKKYYVSIMQHGPNFQHIVHPLKIPLDRRVALFNYKSDIKL